MDIRKIKILVIDDNQDNLISLKALLKDSFPKASVFTALTGQKGLELAADEDPDVILLDISMPIMDGFEVCRRLKADNDLSEIPVVFVTATKGDKESRILALERGAEAFLAKPIDESELIAQIRAMVKIRAANIQKHDEKERLAGLVEEKTYELKKAHLTTLNLLEDLKKENEARKESERSLLESEEKYRRIAENISDVVWTADLSLKTTYVSPSIERLLGESIHAHMNRTIEERFTPDSLKKIHSVLMEELEKDKDPKNDRNRTRMFEVEHYRADGIIIWISMHISLIRDKNENVVGFQGVTRDITERKKAEIELRQTKEYLEKLIGYANAPIVVWNQNFKITKFNGIFETLIGRKADEVLGKDLGILFPPHKLNDTKSLIENIRKGKNLETTEIDIIHMDGLVRTVLWSLATIYDKDDISNFSTIAQGQDITDRIAAEKKLIYLSYHDQLTGIYNRRFFEEELERLDTKRNLPITIVIGDINGLKFINDSFGHTVGDELLNKAGEIIKKGCRADDIIARYGGDEFVIILPKTDTFEATQIINRIRNLASNEKVANVDLSISFGYDTKEIDEQTISEILENAENQMYRHKLYERSSMRSKTVDIIMNTLFEKSSRESLHSKRVSEICQAIASKMNFEKDDVSQIRIAGLVHDIGKIGVDEEILNKTGSLSNDGRKEMEKHPETGWRILSATNEFSELAQSILEHHEKWDGSGYPKGLKGEEISIEARIITVADAYDAMTSERSYRKGVSKEEAIEEIKRCSGAHFDPKIAKVFVEKVLGKV